MSEEEKVVVEKEIKVEEKKEIEKVKEKEVVEAPKAETPEVVNIHDEKTESEAKPALTSAEARGGRRRRKTPEEMLAEHLSGRKPKTKLGRMVRAGKIKDLDEVLDKKIKILEPEIVDTLAKIDSELLFAGQSKGKFGGGKRRAWRQAQKKTKEGNIVTFSALAVVGDRKGHIGLGFGKAKETLPAREKALRKAKMNIFRIKRGSGSFEGGADIPHSIPFKVSGKCGSVNMDLMPASQGTGLVIGDEGKKILRLAGIEDIYSKSKGQTNTTINYAKAVMQALEKLG